MGGACVVALYKRMIPEGKGVMRKDQTSDPEILEKQEQVSMKPKLWFKSITNNLHFIFSIELYSLEKL